MAEEEARKEIGTHVWNLIRAVTEKQSLNDDVQVTIKEGAEKGDNYIGKIKAIDVTPTTNSNKEFRLILKMAPESASLRKQFPIRELYLRETLIYEEIMPLLNRHQKGAFDGVAKFLGGCLEENRETICLENLRAKGYEMWPDKMRPMDEAHVKIVLEKYAHLHALSLSLKQKNCKLFKTIEEKLPPTFSPDVLKSAVPNYQEKFDYLIENFKQEKRAVKFLTKLRNKVYESFCKSLVYEDVTAVVVHGDCWCNNFMFQYKDEIRPNEPTQVVFLDWQMSKISSFLCDVVYFFYTGASKSVVDECETYQRFYYERLVHFLRKMECDVDEFAARIYTFERFASDWKSHDGFAFTIATAVLRVMFTDRSEVQAFEEATESGRNFMDAIGSKKSLNDALYLQRIKILIDHFIQTENY